MKTFVRLGVVTRQTDSRLLLSPHKLLNTESSSPPLARRGERLARCPWQEGQKRTDKKAASAWVGYESALWQMADARRDGMDAAVRRQYSGCGSESPAT